MRELPRIRLRRLAAVPTSTEPPAWLTVATALLLLPTKKLPATVTVAVSAMFSVPVVPALSETLKSASRAISLAPALTLTVAFSPLSMPMLVNVPVVVRWCPG